MSSLSAKEIGSSFSEEERLSVSEAVLEISRLEYELDRLRKSADGLSRVVASLEKRPKYEKKIAAKHRVEWPDLWRKIDQLVNDYTKTNSSYNSVRRFKTGEPI